MSNIRNFKDFGLQNNIPTVCSIEITQKCNFKCRHCYIVGGSYKEMSLLQFEKLVDILHANNVLFITLTGGEVLLHREFIDMYTYAKKKGFFITIFTNGSLITNEIIELFKEYNPWRIYITLYGSNKIEYFNQTENSNSYNMVKRGLILLKKNNIKFSLRTIATREMKSAIKSGRLTAISSFFDCNFNYDTLVFPKYNGDNEPLSQRLSVDEIMDLEESDSIRVAEWVKIVNDENRKLLGHKCSGGVYSFFVSASLTTSICAVNRQNQHPILEENFNIIWKKLNKDNADLLQQYYNSECSSCHSKYVCRWCPTYSYMENKVWNLKIDYFCELSRQRLMRFIKK